MENKKIKIEKEENKKILPSLEAAISISQLKDLNREKNKLDEKTRKIRTRILLREVQRSILLQLGPDCNLKDFSSFEYTLYYTFNLSRAAVDFPEKRTLKTLDTLSTWTQELHKRIEQKRLQLNNLKRDLAEVELAIEGECYFEHRWLKYTTVERYNEIYEKQ